MLRLYVCIARDDHAIDRRAIHRLPTFGYLLVVLPTDSCFINLS